MEGAALKLVQAGLCPADMGCLQRVDEDRAVVEEAAQPRRR